MRKLFTMIIAIASLQSTYAVVVTDTVSTGPQYANQVWYSLPNDEQGSSLKDNWDLAFEISGYTSAIFANTQKGILVYQSPYPVSQWAMVDTLGIEGATPLSNAETNWEEGALNTNPDNDLDLGWGDYDMNTHSVTGDSVYIIKLASGAWKKFKMNSLASSVYSFTWSDLDGQNEQTGTVTKSGFTGKNFGYFSLENNTSVDREPVSADWDITFTKYMTVILAPEPTPYGVTGVVLNKGVSAIKASGVNVTTVDYTNHTFQSEINTIGWEWKTFAGTWTVEDSLAFFVKRTNGDIWKVIFTGFGGSSTGNYIFSKELVYEASTGINDIDGVSALTVYPNPAHNQVSVVYNYDKADSKNAGLTIYDMSGRLVMQENFSMVNGFNQHIVDVSQLNGGIYMVSIPGTSKTQKLIIQ
ncbi:MAG TPA: T9SS type A sorting domain-containing protein [Chitinophagales bacterium]|nr:T9SS type A sorting domain-containing protein [Chitinophagales bacterium]